MLLLAFDTATPGISVAVHDGSSVIGQAHGAGAMAHGELLAPAIDTALRAAQVSPADLTDVAVGVGPGPFTGLRVGVVTALTLGQTLGLTTHGVCSLDVLAADAAAGAVGEFIVATDARRKEVYWARYDSDGTRVEGPAVDRPDVVAARGLPVIGRGGSLYPDVLAWHQPDLLDPAAATMANLVANGTVARLPLEPLYLRRPDAIPQAELRLP